MHQVPQTEKVPQQVAKLAIRVRERTVEAPQVSHRREIVEQSVVECVGITRC